LFHLKNLNDTIRTYGSTVGTSDAVAGTHHFYKWISLFVYPVFGQIQNFSGTELYAELAALTKIFSYLEFEFSGLDHVQITLESHNPLIHNQIVRSNNAWKQTVSGIKNALATSSLYVMTNTTLLQSNSPLLEETLNFLAEIGVKTVGLNALIHSGRGKLVGTGLDENELEPLLKIARHFTQKNNQKLIWYTPTQYCNFDPMSLELGVKGCTAALYNMCVEPDGGVLPCQSYYHQLGNLLTDSWDSIWNHDLSIFIRERKYVPEKCNSCLLLAECGGGCPLLYEETIDQELFSRTSIIR